MCSGPPNHPYVFDYFMIDSKKVNAPQFDCYFVSGVKWCTHVSYSIKLYHYASGYLYLCEYHLNREELGWLPPIWLCPYLQGSMKVQFPGL